MTVPVDISALPISKTHQMRECKGEEKPFPNRLRQRYHRIAHYSKQGVKAKSLAEPYMKHVSTIDVYSVLNQD